MMRHSVCEKKKKKTILKCVVKLTGVVNANFKLKN